MSGTSSGEDSVSQNDHNLSHNEYNASSNEDLMLEIDSYSPDGLSNAIVTPLVNGPFLRGDLSSNNKEISFTRTQESTPNACGPGPSNSSPALRKRKDEKKRELSNQLRLESLQERTQIIQKQKDVIKNALQIVDVRHYKGSNYLLLGDNDDELKMHNGSNVCACFLLSIMQTVFTHL